MHTQQGHVQACSLIGMIHEPTWPRSHPPWTHVLTANKPHVPLLPDSSSLRPHHIWILICCCRQGCGLSVQVPWRALDAVTITTWTRMQVLAWRPGVNG